MTNPLVQEATEKTQEIEQKIEEFFDKVNEVISWVPGIFSHLIEPIVQGMEQLRQKVQEFWDRVNQLFEQPGNSDRLKEVGEQWVTSIGNVLGDIADTLSLDRLRTNFEWTGSAAEAYKATVPAQGQGLNNLKDLAVEMRGSLDSLADSIDSFWLAMKIVFVGLLVAAGIAIAGALSVVGIPAAIAVILGAAAAAITAVGYTISALNAHVDTIETQQSAIQQQVHDVGAEWSPSNIAAMSDASVTDGDASDWRPL